MRSVVVVLPASMWAAMPMLRVFASVYCLAIFLPAVMGECFVRLGHAVRVLALLDRLTLVAGGVHDLSGKLVRHRTARARARILDEPAHAHRLTAIGADLHRH